MQKNKIKKNKASVLAVTMIILGLVLSIGLSASLISISNKKVSISSNKSNLAYSKAQSGIEAFLYKIKNAGTSDTIQTLDGSCSNGIINSSGGYKMEFKDEEGNYITNCSVEISEIRTIKSTGIVPGNNQRSIEAAVAAEVPVCKYVTATTTKYDGKEVGGYSGGNAKCDAIRSGSRMCMASDFINDLPDSDGWYSSFTGESWGGVNDCQGWTSKQGWWNAQKDKGPVWDAEEDGPSTDHCGPKHKILCCVCE